MNKTLRSPSSLLLSVSLEFGGGALILGTVLPTSVRRPPPPATSSTPAHTLDT